jgi:hypothetical protein
MRKKIFLLILGTLHCISHANNKVPHTSNHIRETRCYGIVGIASAPAIFTDFGLGFRMQDDYVGFDFCLERTGMFALATCYDRDQKHFNFSTKSTLKFTPSFLIYPHPNLKSEWYTGLGCELGTIFNEEMSCNFLAPVIIVGKKYINTAGRNRFIEFRITVPTMFSAPSNSLFGTKTFYHTTYSPILTIKYGIVF